MTAPDDGIELSMAQDLFRPRADLIDGEFWIETPATASATAALWAVLRLSREADPWLPVVVLTGEHGSGKTTLARRFSRAARRNIACDLVNEKLDNFDSEQAARDDDARRGAFAWAERMVRGQGGDCPGICAPAAWVPEHLIAQALADAQTAHPTLDLTMASRPDMREAWLGSPVWRSVGNREHHPTRRTSMAIVDNADALLSVPPVRRRACLENIFAFGTAIRLGHPLAWVLIGSPKVAEMTADYGSTHVIRVDPMPNDPTFASICEMIFGTREADDVAALHRASRGLMGPLTHIARLRGLEPPYRIPPEEILRLPALPAPETPG